MNYQQAVDWIHGQYGLGHKNGLENEKALLRRLGDPHRRFPCVHVAGTNGKGSTCAMIASVLKESGLRVGLYTSPFLLRYNERICINGEPIPDEDLAQVATQVRVEAEALAKEGILSTVFELGTACAFHHFAREKVDVAVIEVGLGGRLDVTNVITPLVSVITHIGIDHEKILGDTVEKIAAEKAGIVKDGVPLALYPRQPRAKAVIEEFCTSHGAPLLNGDDCSITNAHSDAYGHRFDFAYEDWSLSDVQISLPGEHQIDNAITALLALYSLRERFGLSDEHIRSGLANTHWPGRLEWIGQVLLDGAHNPQGAQALREYLAKYLPGRPIVAVCGTLRDKDYSQIVKALAPALTRVVCVTPDSHRATSAQDMAALFAGCGVPAEPADGLLPAIDAAKAAAGENGIVLVCGSLYLVGEAKRLLTL